MNDFLKAYILAKEYAKEYGSASLNEHNTDSEAHNDIRELIEILAQRISGEAHSFVYQNKQDANYVSAISKTGSFVVGDTIYFKDLDVSDEWVTAVNQSSPYYSFQEIEVEKIDLTGYAKETFVTSKINALNKSDAAVNGQFVTSVSEANGIISIIRRALQASDIPTLPKNKIEGFEEDLIIKDVAIKDVANNQIYTLQFSLENGHIGVKAVGNT